MKKEVVLFGVLFLLLVTGLNVLHAQGETDQEKVNNAYNCLNAKIDSNTCSVLTTNEKIFSLLSTGKCERELIAGANPNGCYHTKGSSTCDLELTAKAGLALNRIEKNTSLQQEWLLNQKGVSKDLNWYLEIDANQPVSCDINSLSQISIGKDKKITPEKLENCFSLAQSGYWLKIDPTCYEEKFTIVCNGDDKEGNFLTTLLFKEKNSPTIHVSKDVDSAAIGGTSYQQINSFCFQDPRGNCDYPGSLWASIFLNLKGTSMQDFLPYLTTGAENHFGTFPSVFLYILTNNLNYRTEILRYQSNEGSWGWGLDKYYGTAIAMLPFMTNSLSQKDEVKTWLLSSGVQQTDGCWNNGNIINNAFLLYTLWPRAPPIPEVNNCTIQGAGYTCCDPSIETCEGELNSTLSCTGSDSCFYKEPNSCLDLGGTNFSCVENSSFCSNGAPGIIDYYSCTGEDFCCFGGDLNEQKFCEPSGFQCVTNESSCIGGTILNDFECGIGTVCCGTISNEENLCSDFEGYGCIPEGDSCDGGFTSSLDCPNTGDACCKETPPIENLCVDDGYSCTFPSSCNNEGLEGYSCAGITVCCDSVVNEETCQDLNGQICSSDEFCKDGDHFSTFDLAYGEICCTSGICEKINDSGTGISPGEDCLVNDGLCKSSCSLNESETSLYLCSEESDSCCMSNSSSKTSYWWVWALFLLIIITVVGILYKDKLKEIIQKMRSKKINKSGFSLQRKTLGGVPPSYERRPQMIPSPRKIIPRQRRFRRRTAPLRKKSPIELEEVLKKLKDIGK